MSTVVVLISHGSQAESSSIVAIMCSLRTESTNNMQYYHFYANACIIIYIIVIYPECTQ